MPGSAQADPFFTPVNLYLARRICYNDLTMVIFRILMIILVAAPVIGIAVYLYGQVLAFVREKNREEVIRNKNRRAAARAARIAKAAEREDRTGGM